MPHDTENHYKIMYSDSLTDLSGHKSKSLLRETVRNENKPGEAVFFDAVSPEDDVNETAFSALTGYRKDYEDIATPDIDDWVNIQTPHHEINRERSYLAPKQIEASHWFRKKDNIALLSHENSSVNKMLRKKIVSKRDKFVYDAIFAASVSRGKDVAALSNVSFPAGQILADITTYSAFTVDVFAEILAMLEDQFIDGERVFMAISPTLKMHLKNNSRGVIHNQDFVSKRHLETGELPDIDGIHVICDPTVTGYKGVKDDAFCVWTEEAMVYNQSDPLEVNFDTVASQRFSKVLYLEEFANAVRVDDKRVIHGFINLP